MYLSDAIYEMKNNNSIKAKRKSWNKRKGNPEYIQLKDMTIVNEFDIPVAMTGDDIRANDWELKKPESNKKNKIICMLY
jgi:hypothetical protein